MSIILYEKDKVSRTIWYSPISSEYHFLPIIIVGLDLLDLRRILWRHQYFTKRIVSLATWILHSTNNCPIFKQIIKPSLYQASLHYVYYIIWERHGFAYHLIFANFIGVSFLTDYRCWVRLVRFTKNFMKTPIFHEQSCLIGYVNFISTNDCPIFKQTIKPSLYQVSLRYVYYIIRERHGFAVPFLKGVGFLSSEVHTYLYSNRFHSGSREKGKLYPPREKTPEVSSPLTNIPRCSHPVEW